MSEKHFIKKIFISLLIFMALVNTDAIKGYAFERNIITDDDPVPLDVRIACDFWGQHYNICPELLEAIACYESGFDPSAQNGTCKGLMQINVAAHARRMQELNVADIYDLDCNVLVAADYIAELFEEYEDVAVVLGKYHGEKNVLCRAENCNFSNYVICILEKSAEFERAHGK